MPVRLLGACAALVFLVLLCPPALAQHVAADVPSDRLIVKWRGGSAAHAQIRRTGDGRISAEMLDAFAKRAGVRLAPHRAMSGDAQVVKLDGRRSVAELRAIAARLAS